jgi:NitT/TauT family transport system permease protein
MIAILQAMVFVAFLLFWAIAAQTFADPFYISTPAAVFSKLATELVDPTFYRDLRVTALELAAGYAAGALGGIGTAVLFGRWPTLGRVFDPFFVAMNSIPRIALAPLLVIWFGIDLASKIVLAATLVYFITFFNALGGIRSVEQRLIDIGHIVGASDWQIFRKIILPGSASWIMAGLRISLPFALIGVIVGEFVAAASGLGFRLNFYATSYNASGTMAMLIVMMVVMTLLNFSIVLVERRLLRWQPRDAAVPRNMA